MRFIFIIMINLLFLGCAKTNNGPNLPVPSSSSIGYFIAKIDGKIIDIEAKSASIWDSIHSSPMGSLSIPVYYDSVINTQILEFQEGTNMNWSKSTLGQGFLVIYIYKDTAAADDVFAQRAVFVNGKFPIIYHNHYKIPGKIPQSADIYYQDKEGIIWESRNGDQTGSNFEITSIDNSGHSNCQTVFKATFNCRLYDGGVPNTFITVENAIFMGGAIAK
jgi:hypothetical protein